jgi:YHS domain-containing protein
MLEGTAQPVFIFLPVEETSRDEAGQIVDPVCGRSLAEGQIAGRLLHGGRHHYFCSLKCAERFAISVREPEMR